MRATRLLAAELTREQLYLQLHAELPYASAVETEKWEERRDKLDRSYTSKSSIERAQSKGDRTRGQGHTNQGDRRSRARVAIAELTGRKVHLFLHVKVKPDWADDREVYRDLGLDWSE